MSHLTHEAARLAEDFRHGGQLGLKSTQRLIHLIEMLANEVERLDRIVTKRPA